MPSSDSIKEELKLLDEIAPLVLARQEIAVNRIKEPQKKVLAARSFFNSLVQIFGQVRAAYEKEVSSARKTREGTAAVLFSPEQHLTGPIASATFKYFLNYLGHHAATPIIIGSIGKERFQSEMPSATFTYVDLQDLENPQGDVMRDLVKQLLNFKTIAFVFGQYTNLIRQSPVHVTIGDTTGDATIEDETRKYLFEPSLEAIVSLFDRNIVALLFDQAREENNLAELGSQITAMERADAAIRSKRLALKVLAAEQKRSDQGRAQRERLTGLFLWLNT